MGKFTAGKWKAGKADFDTSVYTEDEEIRIAIMRGLDDYACIGVRENEAHEIQRANARLIAAAPEMYELLRELLLHNDYGLSLQQAEEISSLLSRIDGDSDAEKQESDS